MSSLKFKQCPNCGVWLSAEDILDGVKVTIIGMTLDAEDCQLNNYYFNHTVEGCGTTFAMNVMDFVPYIPEPIEERILAGEAGCDKHCQSLDDMQLCRQNCRWAPFRRFMSHLMSRQIKRTSSHLLKL